MDTITLELREKESNREYGNGDWESVVAEKITLYDGDQIIMRNVFIDTQATSNDKINIPKDLILDFEFIYYHRMFMTKTDDEKYWVFSSGIIQQDLNSGALDDINIPTGKMYIPATQTEVTKTGMAYTSDFRIQFISGTPVGKVMDAFDMTVTYKDHAGDIQNITVHIPAMTNKSPFFVTNQDIKLPHGIFFDQTYDGSSGGAPVDDGLGYTPSINEIKAKWAVEISYVATDLAPATSQIINEPLKGKKLVTLPQGSYSPTDLCNFINTQITSIESFQSTAKGLNNPVATPFCFAKKWQGLTTGVESPVQGLTPGGSVIVGASNMELSYIDAQQRFSWDRMHTPIYDVNGVESVLYDTDAVANGGAGKVAPQNSGICFTHLSATRKDTGAYFDFWEGLLGFDLQNDIYPENTGIHVYKDGESASNFFEFKTGGALQWVIVTPTFSIPSSKITGGLATIDALVPKGQTFVAPVGATGKNFFLEIPTNQGKFYSPTNQVTTRVIGSTSVLGAESQFGYFLVEVMAKFRNVVTGKSANKNNIVGIIGRFYELNSYTQGSESDSLVYTHGGAPLLLDSFKCRILDSDKNLAGNLGNDNTIFMQVNRAPKNKIKDLPPALQAQALKEMQSGGK